MSILDNIRANRAKTQQVANMKYKLLQRFTMAQLQDVYEKYIAMDAPVGATQKNDPDSVLGAFQTLGAAIQSNTSGAGNRTQLIDKISKQMSFDTLSTYAKEHKISTADL